MNDPSHDHTGQAKKEHPPTATIGDDEDEDDDEWDGNGASNGVAGDGSKIELTDINWNDIDDEVDAAMAESDDDEEDEMDDSRDTDGISDAGSVGR